MARLALFVVGLVIGAAGVTASAAWLRDPVDASAHVARECRLIAALEHKRMDYEVLRARDTPLPYQVFRAQRVTGAPKAFEPRSWRWKLIDRLLARQGRKAVAPIDCGAALDAAKVPASVLYLPGKPRSVLRSAYSRAAFWPGDRFALVSWRSCDLLPQGWSQETQTMLLRRDGENWRQVEHKDQTLLLVTQPYNGRAMPCFAE
jgi:hypothetical protein